MNWPLEQVALVEPNGFQADEWTGYLVPYYLAGLPNDDTRACYSLVFECGLIWQLGPGQLDEVIWGALEIHEHWCMHR